MPKNKKCLYYSTIILNQNHCNEDSRVEIVVDGNFIPVCLDHAIVFSFIERTRKEMQKNDSPFCCRQKLDDDAPILPMDLVFHQID